MTTDDQQRLEAIKKRVDRASALYGTTPYWFFGNDADHDEYHVTIDGNPTEIFSQDDATFIARARTDIPWLIERLQEAEAALTEVIEKHGLS
jgi:hypothetical protein